MNNIKKVGDIKPQRNISVDSFKGRGERLTHQRYIGLKRNWIVKICAKLSKTFEMSKIVPNFYLNG